MASRRRRAATHLPSTPARALLLDRDVAEQLDLVREVDAELLPRAAACLGDESERVLGAGPAGVLDEVRVLGRDLGAADAVTLQPTRLEYPSRTELVVRVLEHAPESAPVRRLCRLALGVELPHRRLDLLRWARRQQQLRLEDDLPVAEARVPVRQPELGRRSPGRPPRGRDERTHEHLREVAAVCAAVHPDAAADRPGDGARELEAAETGRAGAMEDDGVRGAPAGAEAGAVDPNPGELARELQHEGVDAVVGDEQVRAEPDGRDRLLAAKQLLDLRHGLGLREGARRPARAEGRVPGEIGHP